DFIVSVLTTDLTRQRGRSYRADDIVHTAMKFQQFTGPVMAKAVEDTAFYRYVRLLSLNEVGGEPGRFGGSPAAFHHANRQRRERWPAALLATATHDHKRGEDARLRIDAISEFAGEWQVAVRRWSRLTRPLRREIDGDPAPAKEDEYLFYQALLGA